MGDAVPSVSERMKRLSRAEWLDRVAQFQKENVLCHWLPHFATFATTLVRELAQHRSGAWSRILRRIQSSSYGLRFPRMFHSVFTRRLVALLVQSQDYPYAL